MDAVYRRFRQKLDQLTGHLPNPSFLLAISGGMDSMVLWDLFEQSASKFVVAHGNFQLRGPASDMDEAFVSKQAASRSVSFFSKHFNTLSYAKQHQLSIQEAARDLRYNWLEELRSELDFTFVVTAHHLDDSLETFLYNFTKGSGLKGLLGIPETNGKIIRPLLDFPRASLEIYYHSRQLSHREDASNASDKYQRNKLRLKVIPVLNEINPGLAERFLRTQEILKDTYYLFQEQVHTWKRKAWKEKGDQVEIDLRNLDDNPALATLLYEWLKDFQFHPDQTRQVVDSFHKNQPGARFFSPTHELLVDRATLFLKERKKGPEASYLIPRGSEQLQIPGGELEIRFKAGQPKGFPHDAYQAFMDADKLEFPLQLRHWKAGDKFAPLGMQGRHKKIQDLFSDQKLNRFEKERVWLLTDAKDQICWVIGLQLDEGYKIKSTTKTYYHITFRENPKE